MLIVGGGGGGAVIVKLGPVPVCPPVTTVTGPVLGKLPGVGSVAVIDPALQADVVAVIPLNRTVPLAPRLVPAMTTCVPGVALLMAAPPVVVYPLIIGADGPPSGVPGAVIVNVGPVAVWPPVVAVNEPDEG